MAVVGFFPATVAVSESGALLRYAEALVYAWDDEYFSSPLRITDLQGIPMPQNKLIASNGIYPSFLPPDPSILQVRAKSANHITPMTSLTVYVSAAQTAAEAAEKAAAQVALDADEVDRARSDAVAAALRAEKAAGNTILIPEPGMSGYYMFGA